MSNGSTSLITSMLLGHLITYLSMNNTLTLCFNASQSMKIACHLVPNMPPQNIIVSTSSPSSTPAIE